MTSKAVGIYYGYKITEADVKELFYENYKNENDENEEESDDFNVWSFRDFIDEFLVGKYATKISCDSLKCCPYKKNSDWIIGINKTYVNIYELTGFTLNTPTEQEMTDLKTVKRVFRIKNQIPQWYVIANDCWRCT